MQFGIKVMVRPYNVPGKSQGFALRPPGGSECQFSHFVLTSIGHLNYFC